MLLDWLNKEFEALGKSLNVPFNAQPRTSKALRKEFYSYRDKELPILEGNYKDLPINVQVFTNPNIPKGGIEIHKMDMSITLDIDNPLNRTLALFQEGNFSGFSKLLGAQDLKIGQATFDRTFMIQSNVPDFAKDVLKDAFCSKLLKLNKHFSCRIEFGDLSIKKVKKEKPSRKGKPKDVLDYELTLLPDKEPELLSEVNQASINQSKLRLTNTGYILTNPVLQKRTIDWLDLLTELGQNISQYE